MSESDPYEAFRTLAAAAEVLRTLPTAMARFYANGGDGVGQGVVGDRYQGQGNKRFAPLSRSYGVWKANHSKELNKEVKAKHGKGSKLIKVLHYMPIEKGGSEAATSLPILVLKGDLRAAVTSRQHPIVQNGDTAVITFQNLPDYAEHHQTGTKRMPRRSPVDPNDADNDRVQEFAKRTVEGNIGQGATASQFGRGTPRII